MRQGETEASSMPECHCRCKRKITLEIIYYAATILMHAVHVIKSMNLLLNKANVIGVCETWGNDDIYESKLNIPGYSLFRADRSNGHYDGGVLLL